MDEFKAPDPDKMNELLRTARDYLNEKKNMLTPDDEAFLNKCLDRLKAGCPSIIMTANENGGYSYMVVNTNRLESLRIISEIQGIIIKRIVNEGP